MIRRRLLGALAASLLPLGCGPARPAPRGPASSPARRRPEELLPAGLDVVVRLDLARLRGLSSSPALDPLREPLARRLQGDDRASLLDLLKLRATTLWGGFRGVPSPDRLDAALVAQGDFASFDPSTSGAWVRSPSARPDRAVFERPGAARGSPSLLIRVGDELLLLATPLEASSLLHHAEPSASSVKRIEAPADGLFGVAARPAVLARAAAEPYPNLASLLRELSSLGAVLDIEQGAMRVDVLMGALSEAGAARLERVLLGWKDAFVAEGDSTARLVAERATVERDGPKSLKARLRLSGDPARVVVEGLLGG